MQIKNYISNMMTIILIFTLVVSGLSNNAINNNGHSLSNSNENISKISGESKFSYLYGCLGLTSYDNDISLIRVNSKSWQNNFSAADDCLQVYVHDGEFCSEVLAAFTLNGVEPFTYIWSNGVTDKSFAPTQPGLYCVTVTDSQGCSGTTCHQYDWLSLEFEQNHTTCGLDNGSIVITALNWTTQYVNYLWNTGATTSTISGLSSGIYSVTATYRHCTEIIENIEINSSDSISVFVEVGDENCGQRNGWISVYPEGDNPNFAYRWSNGEVTQVITDLAAGTYTVTIVDDDLCEAIRTITVNSLNDFYVTSSVIHTTCGFDNGSITVSGSDSYVYQWSTGDTTQTISNLPPGEYTVTVTSDDGCEAIATSTIDSSGHIEILTDIKHTSCGFDNGSITANPINGHGYSFLWSNGDTTQTISNLEPGDYTVTVSAAGGCSEEQIITVNESSSEIDAEIDVVHTSCGLKNGTITVNPLGGTNFTYLWSGGDTTQTITDLEPGEYTVTVSAAGGCSDTFIIEIKNSNQLIVTNSVTQPQCSETTGSIIAEPINGNTFTYIWSTGDTTQTITDLEPGDYTVTVTNEEGCTATSTSTILASKPLNLTIMTFEETCEGCNDASLTALADGNAPYTYEWSNGATTQSIDELEPGVYFVTVTDDIGCSKTEVAIINRVGCDPPTIETKATDAPCYGENGTVTVTVSGGATSYSYDWSSGENTSHIEVPAGSYYVIVTDSLECIAYTAVDISHPEAIITRANVTDEVCYGDENGTIDVTVSGDFPPFTYDWSHGSTESTLKELVPDEYTATITDANGCTTTISVAVRAAEPINVPINGDTLVCFGAEGSLEVTEVFAQYQWSSGETTQTITWTKSDVYTVTVTNDQGCTATTTVTTTVNDELDATISKEDNVFVLEVKGGTAPYTYLWSTGEETEKIIPEVVGTYTVTVTDSNGCTSVVEADFTVSTKEQVSTLPLQVYPNPATNVVYITLPESEGESIITIYDGSKRLISEQRATSASDVLKADISQLVPGTYILQVQNKNGYYRTKVVKQ